MGNDLLICEKCGRLYDSYAGERKCQTGFKKNQVKKMVKRFNSLPWQKGYINEKFMCYYISFWENAENVINNPDRDDEDIQQSIKFVNTFIRSIGDVERFEDHELKQTDKDIEEAKKVYGFNPVERYGLDKNKKSH